MKRRSYRPHLFPRWIEHMISLVGLVLIFWLLNAVMPLILEGLAR